MIRIIEERRNAYSSSQMLEKAIRFDANKVIYSSLNEAVMYEPSGKEKGGIVVFSEEVNAIKLSSNKLVNFLKQNVATLSNRINKYKNVDTIANKNELVGWTIGNFLNGRYKAKNGKTYGEKSLSVEIIGVDTDKLFNIAEELCIEFLQESVLVKDYSSGRIAFVEPNED